MSGPPRFLMARMPVGEVTLISVRKPSITSMPTNSRPRSRRAGPRRAQISRSRVGEVGRLRHAAAHHVGAQIVRRRHAVDRAGEFAVDQDDALVAVLHRRQEFLHHPGLAEHGGEQIVERAEIEILAAEPEHRFAAFAVERLHDDVAVLGAKRLDGVEIARDQRRRHQFGKFGDEDLFRRVAHVGRIVDHERLRDGCARAYGSWRCRRGRTAGPGAAARRRTTARSATPRLAEREMIAGDIAHRQRPHRRRHFAVAQRRAGRACNRTADGRGAALPEAARRSKSPRILIRSIGSICTATFRRMG